MSKGLEELEALERLYVAGRLDLDYVCSNKHKEDYNIIEKSLKALEIIKEIDKTSLLHFIAVCVKDQNKYDLLKEVLL